MKQFAITSCVALFSALIAMSVPAAALTPSTASAIVTLRADTTTSSATCGGFSNVKAFDQQLRPDGTLVTGFSIPAGQVLVVTSGEVWYIGSAPGQIGTVEVNIGPFHQAFVSSAVTGPGEYAHEAFSFPTGIVVSPGQMLCANNQGATSFFAIVNGFLAPRK